MHLETEGEEEFGEKTGKSVLEDEKGQGGWHTEGGLRRPVCLPHSKQDHEAEAQAEEGSS